MTVKAELGNSAAWYWRQGIPIFPVHGTDYGMCSFEDQKCKHPGKHPITQPGFKDSTANPDRIADWWSKWSDANLGMPKGAVSGRIAIDIGPRSGGDECWDTVRSGHELPDTAEQITSRDRLLRKGCPYLKMESSVRYRPSDVGMWLGSLLKAGSASVGA